MSSTTTSPDIEGIIAALNLEQKISLLCGKNFWETVDIPSHNIPSVKVTDGPNGARGGIFVDGCKAACFPAGVLLAATWDLALARRVGNALAEEALSKGARVLLGPTVCPHRHPFGGRNFESFSEDPLLAGEIAASYINGLQEKGVGATVKHFAANEQETARLTANATVSERALREIYLKPFEIAVKKADPWAIMTSYNVVNGVHADGNDFLLKEVLRGNWGWKGLVMSDWGGTNSTAEALNAGLDLEMPGPSIRRSYDLVKKAIDSGETTEETIDARCRNVLDLLVKANCFNDPTIPEEQAIDNPKHRELIREVGGSGMVLLKNDKNILPLKRDSLKGKTVLMTGLAKQALIHGGGSAMVSSHRRISPWDAMSEILGSDVNLQFARGARIFRNLPPMEGEFTLDRVSFDGEKDSVKLDKSAFSPLGTHTKYSQITLTGTYTATETGLHYLSSVGLGPTQVYINDALIYDQPKNIVDVMAFFFNCGDQEILRYDFEAGKEYRIRVTSVRPLPDKDGFNLLNEIIGFHLGFMNASQHDEDVLTEAVDLARTADLVIVCTGHTPDWETEGQDQKSFNLPAYGSQDALVAGVAKVNKNVVVVNSTGVAVAMPWIDDVAAVLQSWFPGQEAGYAIADVLLGDVNPSGRLPVSFPKRIEDAPAYGNFPGEVVDGRLEVKYAEGVFMGYRHYDRVDKGKVLFPFGHGLSYTSFSVGDLAVEKKKETSDATTVRVTLTIANTGSRAGSQTLLVFAAPRFASAIETPVRQLVGFAKVALEAGQKKEGVSVDVETKGLAYFEEGKGKWIVEKGVYGFEVVGGDGQTMSQDVELEEGFEFEP